MIAGTASAIDFGVFVTRPGRALHPLVRPEASYVVPQRPVFDLVHERTETGWVVLDRATGIHGYGSDPLTAALDFRNAVREHLEMLERQQDLSEALEQQLRYVRDRVPDRD